MIADYASLAQDAVAKALGLDPNARADVKAVGGLLSQNADVETSTPKLAARVPDGGAQRSRGGAAVDDPDPAEA